jgi:hypothetical protein
VLQKITVEDLDADDAERANPFVVNRLKKAQSTYICAGILLGPYPDDDDTRWVKENVVVISPWGK